jgi:hypothetical protein
LLSAQYWFCGHFAHSSIDADAYVRQGIGQADLSSGLAAFGDVKELVVCFARQREERHGAQNTSSDYFYFSKRTALHATGIFYPAPACSLFGPWSGAGLPAAQRAVRALFIDPACHHEGRGTFRCRTSSGATPGRPGPSPAEARMHPRSAQAREGNHRRGFWRGDKICNSLTRNHFSPSPSVGSVARPSRVGWGRAQGAHQESFARLLFTGLCLALRANPHPALPTRGREGKHRMPSRAERSADPGSPGCCKGPSPGADAPTSPRRGEVRPRLKAGVTIGASGDGRKKKRNW